MMVTISLTDRKGVDGKCVIMLALIHGGWLGLLGSFLVVRELFFLHFWWVESAMSTNVASQRDTRHKHPPSTQNARQQLLRSISRYCLPPGHSMHLAYVSTTAKQTFPPAFIFAFSLGIFVFGTKRTISPGCILKQWYKVPTLSVWQR